MTILLEEMIAAGRLERMPARTPWPMHQALHWLWVQSGRRGLRGALAVEMTFTPSPAVGRCVSGADAGLRTLIQRGVLREAGRGLNARLEVEHNAIVAARRRLLTMEPEWVTLLQRAGERWAAWASTAEKYATSATESPVPIVASLTA